MSTTDEIQNTGYEAPLFGSQIVISVYKKKGGGRESDFQHLLKQNCSSKHMFSITNEINYLKHIYPELKIICCRKIISRTMYLPFPRDIVGPSH